MPKYEPDTDHWENDDEDESADEPGTQPDPDVSVTAHRITIHDSRENAKFTYMIADGGVRAGYPNEEVLEDFPLYDAPPAHAYALTEVLDTNFIESTHPRNDTPYEQQSSHEHDAVTVETHEVNIDDLRENAQDPRGMRYSFNISKQTVTAVSGGHYFKDSAGNRITSQWDPMMIHWGEIPAAVKLRLALELGHNTVDNLQTTLD